MRVEACCRCNSAAVVIARPWSFLDHLYHRGPSRCCQFPVRVSWTLEQQQRPAVVVWLTCPTWLTLDHNPAVLHQAVSWVRNCRQVAQNQRLVLNDQLQHLL